MHAGIVWCPHCAKHGHLQVIVNGQVFRGIELASRDVMRFFIDHWNRRLERLSDEEAAYLRYLVSLSALPEREEEIAPHLQQTLQRWHEEWSAERKKGAIFEELFLNLAEMAPHPIFM